jgi:hypothetical protein
VQGNVIRRKDLTQLCDYCRSFCGDFGGCVSSS